MLGRFSRQDIAEYVLRGPELIFDSNDWASALFTDESRFNLRRSDGRARVYRRRGERFHDACVVEIDRFGGGSVMICGGISLQHKTVRAIDGNLNLLRYQKEVLAPVVIPFIRTHLTSTHDSYAGKCYQPFCESNKTVSGRHQCASDGLACAFT